MVRSLRAAAMATSILGLPASMRRWRKALRVGPVATGGKRGEKEGGANALAAAGDHGFAFPLPRLAGERSEPGETCDLLAVEPAELRQFGDEGACGDRPHAGNGGKQVFLFSPGRRAANAGIDFRIDLSQLLLERGDQPGDALADAFDLSPPLSIALGDDHLDDLSAARDEVGEQLGRFVGERTQFRPGRLDEAGDHRRVDRVGLGALADRLGEMAHLRGIDDHQRQRSARERRRDHRFEAAGGFDRDPLGLKSAQAADEFG